MGTVSYGRGTPVLGFRVEVDRSEDSTHVGAIGLVKESTGGKGVSSPTWNRVEGKS